MIQRYIRITPTRSSDRTARLPTGVLHPFHRRSPPVPGAIDLQLALRWSLGLLPHSRDRHCQLSGRLSHLVPPVREVSQWRSDIHSRPSLSPLSFRPRHQGDSGHGRTRLSVTSLYTGRMSRYGPALSCLMQVVIGISPMQPLVIAISITCRPLHADTLSFAGTCVGDTETLITIHRNTAVFRNRYPLIWLV